ncbi:GntR family transcriptional regulator [Caballeronia sp. 15711]|uniref:GntR family transcriptional regulator n=1 Tax=Caballeronia sp. 15711 TaxID=3391029 RepID=UPI0039E6ED5A
MNKPEKKIDEYKSLRDMIVNGQILPNERIVEADYAEQFNTNRANVRRALSRLEQEGLVVSTPFRGARVRLISPEEAVEIFEVRGAVEVLLVKAAAEKVTDADKTTLRNLLTRIRAAAKAKDPMSVGSVGRRLREELWRISGHDTGIRVLSTLNSQLVRIWFQSVMMPGRAEAIVTDMEDIVEAVCAGSATRAMKAMQKYHDGAVQALKKALRHRVAEIG